MKKMLSLCLLIILSGCKKDQIESETLYEVQVVSSQGGSVNTSGGNYPIDTQLEITATPDANFEFTGWSGNATGNDNPLSYTVNGNATITANFSQLVTYSLAVSSTVGGSVNDVNSDYAEGTSVELIAEPDNGYEFVSWTEDGTVVSSDGTFQYTVESDALLIANFREIISINFANSNVSPDVNGFNATTDLIIQGNAEIISRGVYLDGQIVTDDSNQNDGITINKNDLSIQEYTVVFYVQTPNEFIESEEFTFTPYEAGYNFDNLYHTLNDATTVVDLFVQYGQKSPLADIEVLDEGFLISTRQSSLENNRVSVNVFGNTLEKQIDNINSSSTYYYQAFVENEFGLFKSEILTFKTKYIEGDSTLGGKVFYVDDTGFHGLIIADIEYLSDELQWSTEYGLIGTYFKSSNESYGRKESSSILAYFETNVGNSPAADYCENIIIEGLDDWYLPNYTELTRAKDRTGFPSISLWSSNEAPNNNGTNEAIYHYNANNAGIADKKVTYKVIPVRKF